MQDRLQFQLNEHDERGAPAVPQSRHRSLVKINGRTEEANLIDGLRVTTEAIRMEWVEECDEKVVGKNARYLSRNKWSRQNELSKEMVDVCQRPRVVSNKYFADSSTSCATQTYHNVHVQQATLFSVSSYRPTAGCSFTPWIRVTRLLYTVAATVRTCMLQTIVL